MLALLLAACASPTPYAPRADGEGFREQQLERDRWRVSFAGNSITDRETVENYLLYRCAEITIENGNDWFRLVDTDLEKSTVYRGSTTGLYDRGFHDYGFSYRPYYGGGSRDVSWPVDSYEAYAIIVVRPGERPQDDDSAYDARVLKEQLGPSIVRPEAADG